jgi:uncharacterized protein DUF7007
MKHKTQQRRRATSKISGVALIPIPKKNAKLSAIDPETGYPREGDIWTPWGYTSEDLTTKYAKGKIISYSTPVHGGFYVAPELNKLIPTQLKNNSFLKNGRIGWYEEDEDWSIVVATFPQYFPKSLVNSVRIKYAYFLGKYTPLVKKKTG